MTLRAHLERRFWLYALLIAGFSWWLRDALTLYAIADAGHDDALFIRQASAILQGDWLGTYDRFTHAKPPFYSIFVAFAFLTGLPLKAAEHLTYLAACLGVSWLLIRHGVSRTVALGGFALMAFCPVLWTPELQRVIREGLYVSQTIGVLATTGWAFLLLPRPQGWRRWLGLALSGLLFASYWTNREEGIWLLPSIALMVLGGWLIDAKATGFGKAALLVAGRRQAGSLAVFSLIAMLGVSGIAGLNWLKYGTFRINDFQTRDFAAAYGAVVRVHDPAPIPLVPASRAKLEAIYAASPAAAELAPALRGKVGDFWGQVSCDNRPVADCRETQSGWFQWALRDAAAEAGYYHDARKTSGFFRRLAREIDAACDEQRLDCGSLRHTMTPPLSTVHLKPLLHAVIDGEWLVLKQRDVRFGTLPASGHDSNRGLFADLTGHDIQPWSRPDEPEGMRPRSARFDALRLSIGRVVTNAQRWITGAGLLLLALTTIVLLLTKRWRRIDARLLVLALAIGGAIDTRVLLLALVHVTAQPAINPLYLAPAIVLLPLTMIGWLAAVVPALQRREETTQEPGK